MFKFFIGGKEHLYQNYEEVSLLALFLKMSFYHCNLHYNDRHKNPILGSKSHCVEWSLLSGKFVQDCRIADLNSVLGYFCKCVCACVCLQHNYNSNVCLQHNDNSNAGIFASRLQAGFSLLPHSCTKAKKKMHTIKVVFKPNVVKSGDIIV